MDFWYVVVCLMLDVDVCWCVVGIVGSCGVDGVV